MFQILMLVGFIAIFYFLLWRPQQKRAKEHKNLIENLAKGDEIATGGGLMGRITKVADDVLTVEIAEGVSVPHTCMVTTDNKMRCSHILTEHGVQHRFPWPSVEHVKTVTTDHNRVGGEVVIDHGAYAGVTDISGDIPLF